MAIKSTRRKRSTAFYIMKRSIKSKTRSAEKSRKAKLPKVSSDLAATPAREQGDPPTAGFVMDRDLFKTIVEDFIVHEMQNPDLTYDTMAVEALQKATEDYMTIVFQMWYEKAQHAGRVTIQLDDVEFLEKFFAMQGRSPLRIRDE